MKLYGPQSDREKSIHRPTLSSSISTRKSISKPIEENYYAKDRELESHTAEAEVGRLQRENSLLTDQLSKILTSYIELKEDEEDAELPPWNTAADAFLPLFDAYDTRIKELEDIANLKTLELSKFQATMDSITSENEKLRELQLNQIHNNITSTTTFDPRGTSHDSRGTGLITRDTLDTNALLHNEIIAELNERIDILMAENGLLTEQKLSITSELEQHHSDLMNRTQELKSLHQQYIQLKKEHSQLKHTLKQVESDRDEAAGQALTYSEALSKVDAQFNTLQEQLTLSKQHEHESNRAYQELKKDLQSALKAHEEDTFNTLKGVKVLEDRIRELQLALLEKTQENDTAQETVRKLKREYQSTRQDAEAMLQVMAGLEKQLSEFTAREIEIEKLAKDSKFKVSEAISVRDQVEYKQVALLKEKIANDEINRLVEENKKMSREKFNIIEQEVDNANRKASEQLMNAEKEMQVLAEIIAKLRTDFEASIRESKSSQEHIDRLKRLHVDENKVLDESMNMMQLKLNEALAMKEMEYQRRVEVQDTNKELRLTVDKLRSQVDSIKIQWVQSERLRKSETGLMKVSIKELQRDLSDKSKHLERVLHELNETKLTLEVTLSSSESKSNDEVNAYRQRANDTEKALRELEEVMSSTDSRNQYIIDKIKESSSHTIDQLETQMESDREKLRVLVNKTSDRDEHIATLEEENKRLLHVIDEAKGTITQLQNELDHVNEKVLELTDQIISSTASGTEALIKLQSSDRLQSDEEEIDRQEIE